MKASPLQQFLKEFAAIHIAPKFVSLFSAALPLVRAVYLYTCQTARIYTLSDSNCQELF